MAEKWPNLSAKWPFWDIKLVKMGKKKVFQSTVVDVSTGEVLEERSVFVDAALEQFGMFRTTEGIEWLLELGEVELKLLVMLHLWSDDDGSVSLSPIRREFVVRKLRTSGRTLRRSLVGLSEKGALLRLSKDDFVVNPSTFFKGGSKELKNKIKNYNGLRASLGRAGRERRFEDEPCDKV